MNIKKFLVGTAASALMLGMTALPAFAAAPGAAVKNENANPNACWGMDRAFYASSQFFDGNMDIKQSFPRAYGKVGEQRAAWVATYCDPHGPTPAPEPTHVTSAILNYGPTGWAGWSCPAGTTVVDGSLVVSGGDLAVTYAWKPGATTGTVNYPATPFGYTYGIGETGYIGQNDNDSGESIVLDFDCMSNL